jgi:hypothetical protein
MDRDRLFEFAARAYVLSQKVDLEELRTDLATRGFGEQEQSSVIATLGP